VCFPQRWDPEQSQQDPGRVLLSFPSANRGCGAIREGGVGSLVQEAVGEIEKRAFGVNDQLAKPSLRHWTRTRAKGHDAPSAIGRAMPKHRKSGKPSDADLHRNPLIGTSKGTNVSRSFAGRFGCV
jgi:hypothetical protein